MEPRRAATEVIGAQMKVLGSARAGEEMVIDGVGKLPAQPFAWIALGTTCNHPDLGGLKSGAIFALPDDDQ